MKIMKSKFLTGIILLLAGLFTACSEKDDYTINTAELITTISTDNPQVGATSATVTGVVRDLSQASSASYKVGVSYGTSQEEALAGTHFVQGTLAEDGTVTATITGLQTNASYFVCTYVLLQNKVARQGNVMPFATTDAAIATADAVKNGNSAELGGTVNVATAATDNVVKGIRISLDEASVNSGTLYKATGTANSYTVSIGGLVPGKTYYYVAYASVNGEEKFGAVKSFTLDPQEVEFIDLGLSVEWASVNVGATKPNEVGGLYGYGDATLFNHSTSTSDYIATAYQGDENDIPSMYIDGAFTPSKDEINELINNTTQTNETVDGVPGIRFTASNGNSIFLPVTGIREGDTTSSEAELGVYWTGSIDDADGDYGTCLSFNAGESAISSVSLRNKGLAIRAVRLPNRPMNLDYLHQEWSIDLNELGKSAVFAGPLYYYGTDDNWNSVTNGYKISGDTWSYCPDWAGNTWICDAKDRGTMEFKADGTVIVKDLGNNASYTGTYTVDTKEHTISLSGAKILHLENFDNLVTNWSTDLKVMSLTEHGLQIAALRDNSTEGPCLLAHNYASSSLVGGNGSKATFDTSKLLYGDIEGKGNFRLELYNEYGSSKADPCVNPATFGFKKNMAVTFKLTGCQFKADAVGQYNAALSFADSSWDPSYWGGTPKFDALVTGDGEYTVWMSTSADVEGAVVFCIDIAGMASDLVDVSAVKAEIVDITTDQNEDKIVKYVPVDNSKILFNNKDGNGTDGRIEIYNEYGDTKANPGVSQSDVNFAGRMAITFTISGIDGNLIDGATKSYKSDISYAAASWSPSYWGGGIGTANVTGDGTYTVYADMGNNVADGAVVWCIEVYGLWKDLVDTSKVKVTIDEIATEAVK